MERFEGRISSFRRGPGTQNPNQVLVRVEGIDGKKARELVGYVVEYRDKHGNLYVGKVVRHHGNNNVVRVVFKPNLPGQALGGKVVVKPPG